MGESKREEVGSGSDSRRFTLDGEPLVLAEFLKDNDFSEETIAAAQALKEGESMNFGGGAFGLFVLRREVDDLPREPLVMVSGNGTLVVVAHPVVCPKCTVMACIVINRHGDTLCISCDAAAELQRAETYEQRSAA